jgi:hypothetical protein
MSNNSRRGGVGSGPRGAEVTETGAMGVGVGVTMRAGADEGARGVVAALAPWKPAPLVVIVRRRSWSAAQKWVMKFVRVLPASAFARQAQQGTLKRPVAWMRL